MSLAAQTFRAVFWSAGASAVQAVLGVLSLAIMAHNLGAVAFGVYGVAITAIALPDMIIGAVLPDTIRQRDKLQARHIDASFGASLLFALIAAVFIAALAAPIATFFKAPGDATLVLASVAFFPVLTAMAATPLALLSRDLAYGAIARVETTSSLFSLAVGAPLALAGFGVWALVAMECARRVTRLILAFEARPWRPGFSGGLCAFSEMARFNSQTLAVYAFGFLDVAMAPFLIARLLGVEAVGIYGLSRRVLDSLTGALTGPFTSVILSSAARMQNDRIALGALLAGLYRTSALVCYPAFLGLAALAPVAVPLAFGEKWSGAILPLQILLLIGLRTATGAFNAGVLRGVDRSSLMLVLLALGVVLQLVFVPLGAAFGIAGVCAALVLRTWATWPLGAWFIKRETGLSVDDQVRAGTAPIPAAIVMALCVWGAQHYGPPMPLAAALALYTLLGAAIYVSLLALLARASFRQAISFARAALRRDFGPMAQGLQASNEVLTAPRAPPPS